MLVARTVPGGARERTRRTDRFHRLPPAVAANDTGMRLLG
jgi:hypothetical protein